MRQLILGLGGALLLWATPAAAQDHPEHPKGTQEHPEHPKDKAAPATMTLDELAAAIEEYIRRDAGLKGGTFLVYDPEAKQPLQLELVLVHKDKLAGLGDGVYFACTDMKTPDGTVYDLDFFMVKAGEGIDVSEISIHKKSGKARYGWKEENGVWKKVAP